MLKELFIIVSLVVAITHAVTRTQCRHDSECGEGECCYYHEGPIIMSRRQSLLPINTFQGGWCERYLLKDEHCNPFDKLNGHCSCGPNLTCHRFEFTTLPPLSSIVKRKLLPGDYRCA